MDSIDGDEYCKVLKSQVWTGTRVSYNSYMYGFEGDGGLLVKKFELWLRQVASADRPI